MKIYTYLLRNLAVVLVLASVFSAAKAQHLPGAIDPGFNTADAVIGAGEGFDNNVTTIALQPDGKIVVGGYFRSYNNILRESMARLNADGSHDSSFNSGGGFNGVVNSIILQPDGKIVEGGWFTTYNQTSRRRIARLFGDEGTALSAGKELQEGLEVLVYPNPSQDDVQLVFSKEAALAGAVKLELHDAMGRQVLSRVLTVAEVQAGVQLATSNLSGGVYFLNIQSKEKTIMKRLVLSE